MEVKTRLARIIARSTEAPFASIIRMAWDVSADSGQLNVRDHPEPDDNCVLAVSQLHLPRNLADQVPIRELVFGSIQNDDRDILERKEIVETPREDGVELAYTEIRHMDPKEKREAMIALPQQARGEGVHCLDHLRSLGRRCAEVRPGMGRSATLPGTLGLQDEMIQTAAPAEAEKTGPVAAENPPRRVRERHNEAMATVHMSEAEVARDLHAVLAKVKQGTEVAIEQDQRPVAVLRAPQAGGPGRKLSECIALAKAYEERLGYAPIPDADFANDVQEGIADSRRDLFDPPAWD